MIELDLVIAGAQDVPALPQSASQLAALFSKDDWELVDIIETVKLDPVLMGRVFRTANSVIGGSVCTIGDIDQAVLRVGGGAILALALGAAARTKLDVSLPCYGLSQGQLWRHSVAAALAVECARKYVRGSAPPEAFAAALLHDIGLLILSHQMRPDVVEMLLRAREEGGRSVIEAEMEILGVHHGEVGGLIARHWGLPEVVVEGITFHHTPEEATTESGRRLSDFVALADAAAASFGASAGEPGEPPLGLLERVGIDEDGFRELTRDVEDQLEVVLSRYE